MDFVEFRNSFDFEDDFVVNNEVSAVFSGDDVFISNLESCLFSDGAPAEFEFVRPGLFGRRILRSQGRGFCVLPLRRRL